MKATLKKITQEMTGSTELTEILNENFETLNEHQHKREMAIFGRLREIETKFDARFDSLETDVKKILNHLSGKKLLTED